MFRKSDDRPVLPVAPEQPVRVADKRRCYRKDHRLRTPQEWQLQLFLLYLWLSGTSFFGSPGSSFIVAATSAKDSSGATATFCGGPVTLDGALNSAMTFGGETPRLVMVTV